MSTNIEREFKTILTAAQAHAIAAAYPFAAAFTQTNHYFDTASGALRQLHVGLRLRQFADHAEQTLKVPTGPGRTLTELTDPLPAGTASLQLTATNTVGHWLRSQGITAPLTEFAVATTQRRLAELPAGLLTLDHTTYGNGRSDWELELEYHHRDAAAATCQAILTRFGITATPPQNKVARAAANR